MRIRCANRSDRIALIKSLQAYPKGMENLFFYIFSDRNELKIFPVRVPIHNRVTLYDKIIRYSIHKATL